MLKCALVVVLIALAEANPINDGDIKRESAEKIVDIAKNNNNTEKSVEGSAKLQPYYSSEQTYYGASPYSTQQAADAAPFVYGASASNYPYSQPALPYASTGYSSPAASYPFLREKQQNQQTQPKTFGHLRGEYGSPALYNQPQPQVVAQPQIFVVPVATPVQSYQPVISSSYPASSCAYGQQHNGANNAYSPLYHRNAEESKLPEQPMQPAVNYQTRYTLQQQPEMQMNDQPQLLHPTENVGYYNSYLQSPTLDTTQDIKYTNSVAGKPRVISYNAIPTGYGYSNMNEIRRHDFVVDDKLNLRIAPNYLMNRMHAMQQIGSSSGRGMRILRAAEEQPEFDSTQNFSPDERVYMEYNPSGNYESVQQQQTLHPVQAKAAASEFYSLAQPQQHNQAMNWQSIPIRDPAYLPFPTSQVLGQDNQYWNNLYQQQLYNENNKVFSNMNAKDTEKLFNVIESTVKSMLKEKSSTSSSGDDNAAKETKDAKKDDVKKNDAKYIEEQKPGL